MGNSSPANQWKTAPVNSSNFPILPTTFSKIILLVQNFVQFSITKKDKISIVVQLYRYILIFPSLSPGLTLLHFLVAPFPIRCLSTYADSELFLDINDAISTSSSASRNCDTVNKPTRCWPTVQGSRCGRDSAGRWRFGVRVAFGA